MKNVLSTVEKETLIIIISHAENFNSNFQKKNNNLRNNLKLVVVSFVLSSFLCRLRRAGFHVVGPGWPKISFTRVAH